MKYYLIFIFFIANLGLLLAQDGRLNLLSSQYSNVVNKNSLSSITPVYEHKGNTLSADSGIVHEDEIRRQFFEAFGNVVITQPSGTVIYADQLHYDATSQLAKLTGNVRLVDKNSVLTTNYLTYNMRSKIGTYTGGGRIITQTDTITSQNAYYFENTADAYFRHKVVVRNPSVKVYTDTMRYNSVTKNTYFFGPTNIKGNNKENLYTEKGVYNTATGVANFNKKNLYTEGSRFLKGDSLHYERSTGIGKAFKNVIFVDTLDKFYAYGGKGVYRQDEESILMTEKPYIITVVDNDSTSNAAVDSKSINTDSVNDKVKSSNKDEQKIEKLKEKEIKNDTKTSKNSKEDSIKSDKAILKTKPKSNVDSVYMTADTLYSRMILAKDYIALDLKLDRTGGQMIDENDIDYGDDDTENTDQKTENPIDEEASKQAITPQKVITKEKPNTTAPTKGRPRIINNNHGEGRSEISKTLKADSVIRKNAVVPQLGHADTVINNALKIAQNKDVPKNDSVTNTVSDTSRTRIVKAYYNVRLYKSDLQAVADSVYYGMQDSMFRFMGRPMIWAEDSQISADTIYMQILNQKMDNALLIENAFMVNVVGDSTKFNQLKGRKITAFFANNNIEKLFVDGNAENLVFSQNDKTKIITEMFHDRGGRIKVFMQDRKIIDYITIKKVDQKVYPFKMINEDNEILPGFIWRPQDRPKSKEDLLNRKRELPKESETKDSKQEGSKLSGSKTKETNTEIEEN